MEERSTQEKEIYKMISKPSPMLPLPLKTYQSERHGNEFYYEIPEDRKQEIFDELWIFDEFKPSLDDEIFDIHEEKTFTMHDFKAIRFEGYNMIVSKYYFQSGGTILDFTSVDEARSVMRKLK